MEELVILNYNTSEVHIYNVSSDVNIDEDYIKNTLGFNPDECSWMFGTNIEIIKYREIIK